MNPHIDLGGLASVRARGAAGGSGGAKVLGRVVLPAAVLAGFAGITAWSLRERWLPRHPVTVAPVAASGGVTVEDDAILFQAAGWVEPEPYAVLVTPLVGGVVKSVDVLEGQTVTVGQTVARLVDEDARLALRRAGAETDLRRAEKLAAEASLAAATAERDNPVDLQRDVAVALAAESLIAAERESAAAVVAEAEADVTLRTLELEIQSELKDKGVQGDRPREIARLVLRKAEAVRDTAKSRLSILEARATAARAETTAAQARLRLRIADTRRVAEADAMLAQAVARVASAEADSEAAERDLRRTEIKSPTAGVVLSRLAVPGMRVGMAAGGESATGGAVLSLYDPDRLQVRVDVPLEHVGKVQAGGRCVVTVESAPGREFAGMVLRSTSQADIQKNTLQVKVRVPAPDRLLRPDMIGRVRFVAPPRRAEDVRPASRLLIPREAVESAAGGASVWVVDGTDMTAARRTVALGPGRQGDLVEVTAGLTVADKVIIAGREGLTEGTRLRIREGDQP